MGGEGIGALRTDTLVQLTVCFIRPTIPESGKLHVHKRQLRIARVEWRLAVAILQSYFSRHMPSLTLDTGSLFTQD
jgi:hypothetical protein